MTSSATDDGVDELVLRPIGSITSPLGAPADAPRQPDEGAPAAAIVILPQYRAAATGTARATPPRRNPSHGR